MVTAAHQFPTGVVLGARRRAELIEWAERGDRLIIEDDYDAELGGEPVGALQGLAPGPGALHRIRQQAPDARDAARLDAASVVDVLGADIRKGDRGRRL